MRASEYAESLAASMTPELKKRIEKTAALERKSFNEVVVSFLTKGASTPSFLGVGAST